MPVIIATWKMEIGKIMFESSLGKMVEILPSQPIKVG
jgi:hypothetical protein